MAGASQLAGGETPGGRSAWAAGTPSDPPSQALQPPFPQLGLQVSCTPALAPQPSLKLCHESSLQTNLVRGHRKGKVPIVLTWNNSHPATSSAPAVEATEGGGLCRPHAARCPDITARTTGTRPSLTFAMTAGPHHEVLGQRELRPVPPGCQAPCRAHTAGGCFQVHGYMGGVFRFCFLGCWRMFSGEKRAQEKRGQGKPWKSRG